MPSISEGFGVAALEAMATGLPVVATNVGGIPEIVDSGKTGLLVEPGNVRGLSQALASYLQSKTLRTNHGSEARIRAKKMFSWPQNVTAMETLYKKLAG